LKTYVIILINENISSKVSRKAINGIGTTDVKIPFQTSPISAYSTLRVKHSAFGSRGDAEEEEMMGINIVCYIVKNALFFYY
jgi:hypothetical protein